jgi:phytoene dehydrogenase-like protein
VATLRYGYRFNLGPHSFHRFGAGAAVYRELGIPIRGGLVKRDGLALAGEEQFRLPMGVWSLLTTSLLSLRGKRELTSALVHIRRFGGTRAGDATLAQWLDGRLTDGRARQVLEALIRQATYAGFPAEQSAAAALAQMKVAMRGTLYIDEGWQKIVDSLHSAAISSGVNFVSSSRIVGIQHDVAVRAVELGGLEVDADRMDTQAIAYPERPEDVDGARLPAENVVLAVDPITAAELAGDAGTSWATARPVTVACLDVALRTLPNPRAVYALGIDQPTHLAVHSAYAQLTPKGGALIHVARYRSDEPTQNVEAELESLLDRLQPGWRDALVHRRFLPSMTVSNALITPGAVRPAPQTAIKGLYLAGDWVAGEGMLSDAALSSARAAANAILTG